MPADLQPCLVFKDAGVPWMGDSRALESGARPLALPDEGQIEENREADA